MSRIGFWIKRKTIHFDSLGRLLYAKQPEQNANANFSYTDQITNNSAWSVKYEYDDNGNITKTTDAEGVYVEGSYDNFNRLKTRNYSDATPDVEFYYDGKYRDISDVLQTATGSVKGKTTGIKSSVSRTNYTAFNNLGQLTAHQQITDGQTYQTSYEYDGFGRLLTETYPSGRTVKVDYNSDGDVSSVYGTVGSQNRLYANGFHYNSTGAMERMRLGNGKWETFSYNNRQQITEIALGNSATDKSLLRLEYDYGNNTQNNGSLRSQKISFNGLADPFEQTYSYDDLNRLQSAEEKVNNSTTWKQTFQYDRYGNRRFDANNTTTLGSCSQAVCNPLINTSDNRFSSGQGYTYDKDGNVTQDASGQQFIYDAENHQTEVKNSSNQTIGQYIYDGEGKRIKKISSTEITVFVYNGGGQLVAEYSTQISQTPQVSHLTSDHLGSARVITNQLGQVTTRKDYAAFGEEIASAQRTSSLNYDTSETRKGYTGYEKDIESGLEFAQARYYNATHGRFTSVDPLTASANVKNPQTFNRYSYVLNSPYKFTDPLGLISSSTGACGQWCPGNDGFGGGMASTYGEADWDEISTYEVTRITTITTTLTSGDLSAQITVTISETFYVSVDSNNNQVANPRGTPENRSQASTVVDNVSGRASFSDSQKKTIQNVTNDIANVALNVARSRQVTDTIGFVKMAIAIGIKESQLGVGTVVGGNIDPKTKKPYLK